MDEDGDAAAARAAAGARRAVLNGKARRSLVPVLVVGVAILSGIMLFYAGEGPAPAPAVPTQPVPAQPASPSN